MSLGRQLVNPGQLTQITVQMRGSDDVDCGQIPLIKITMAENNGVSLLRDAHFALIKGNLERKVNSTELCDTSTGVILLRVVYNTVVGQWFVHICHICDNVTTLLCITLTLHNLFVTPQKLPIPFSLL